MKPQRTPRRRKPPRRGAKPAAKKVAAGAPVMQVGGGGRRPPAKRPKPRPKPSGGEGVSFVTVMLFIVALAVAGLMAKVMMAGDLSHIDGFPKARWAGADRNLLDEVQAGLGERSGSIEITEEEVNAYLRDRIKGKQGGPFAAVVKYQGTYVDFEKGSAEFYVVRTVFGKNFPISTRFTLKNLGARDQKWLTTSGSIGGWKTGAKQFAPVAKAILRVAEACEPELEVLKMMTKVTLADDKVILEP